MIVDFLLGSLGLSDITYFDIGANHPTHLSNTYLFYRRGHRGVCVEPDPSLFVEIERVRRRDVCLNIGVGMDHRTDADFYIMSSRTLNTFSKEEAERYQSYGSQKIERVLKLPLVPINAILEEHFNPSPNFVSLDVEGLDLEILKSFNFSRFRPEVFCVETLTYTEDRTEEKITDIIDLMTDQGYSVYADTYINTIFVDGNTWRCR